mmetsp:Transcript_28131/g.39111  ORF Transcript_28131/g.39111 Transcript_28131/m.39111 type:complete len:87 (-) Transcript_28131:702-962(-)
MKIKKLKQMKEQKDCNKNIKNSKAPRSGEGVNTPRATCSLGKRAPARQGNRGVGPRGLLCIIHETMRTCPRDKLCEAEYERTKIRK